MTKMPDTDPTPRPDRDREQERAIKVKKDAQERSDARELNSPEAEAMDAFVKKSIKDHGA